MKFKKGDIGNPTGIGGYKKGDRGNPISKPIGAASRRREMIRLTKLHTTEALETIVEIMRDRDQPAASRLVAANSILDRGFGKAIATVVTTIDAGNMSPEELKKALPFALKKMGITDIEKVYEGTLEGDE